MNGVKLSALALQQQLDEWAARIFVASLLLILFLTLFPFDFAVEHGFSLQQIVRSFHHPTSPTDVIGNIWLFIPLGFGLTCLLYIARLQRIAIAIAVVIFSGSLSLTVEVLQVFLPSRASTLTDILANTLGGFLGYLSFYWGWSKIFRSASRLIARSFFYLSVKRLTTILVGYVLIILLISIALQQAATLSNWDPSFPLALGNEATGNRPWRGSMAELYIADRAITKQSAAAIFANQNPVAEFQDHLLAAYQLTGITAASDIKDQTEHLANLVWKPSPSGPSIKKGVSLSPEHWLITTNPVAPLTQKLLQTSQFTLVTTIATADPTQTGPARIISISEDSLHRNFTLAQENAQLILRLRTVMGGANGASPEIVLPNVFATPNLHRLVLTYDRSTLCFYIDGLQHTYTFQLTPAIGLLRYLYFGGDRTFQLNPANQKTFKVLFYGLLFVPLGLLLALITIVAKKRSRFYPVWLGSGILLPALILEVALAATGGRQIQLENLLLAVAATGIAGWLFLTGTELNRKQGQQMREKL
jgi:glycopeptide antibiotics resistance protein